MKVIITRHPNPQCRMISSPLKLSDKYVSSFDIDNGELPGGRFCSFVKEVRKLNLIHEVSVNKYSLDFQIERGFQHEEDEWQELENAVLKLFLAFIEAPEDTVPIIKDERSRKLSSDNPDFESDFIHDYTVNITGLKRFVDKITIPHDFETHRLAWRAALELALVNAKAGYSGPYDTEEANNEEANITYWEHELKAFDAAFDKLLALRLPQDA